MLMRKLRKIQINPKRGVGGRKPIIILTAKILRYLSRRFSRCALFFEVS